MFVGFDDDQPQVHEVCSSTRLEVHSTSMKCSCEQHRCQRHPSSEFCGSKLLLASLDPRPISHASETCCDTWETAVASLEPPPTPSASWSGQGQGQGQSHKKRRVIGTMMRKPNAQSQTIPEEPSPGELKGPFTLVRREKCQSRLAEAQILQRRRKLPHRVAGPSENLSYFLGNGTELKKCLEHCALPRRAAAHLWHSQLPKGTVFCLSWHETNLNEQFNIGTATDHVLANHTPRICLAIQCQILHHSYSLHAPVLQLTLRSRKAIKSFKLNCPPCCALSLRWSNNQKHMRIAPAT